MGLGDGKVVSQDEEGQRWKDWGMQVGCRKARVEEKSPPQHVRVKKDVAKKRQGRDSMIASSESRLLPHQAANDTLKKTTHT